MSLSIQRNEAVLGQCAPIALLLASIVVAEAHPVRERSVSVNPYVVVESLTGMVVRRSEVHAHRMFDVMQGRPGRFLAQLSNVAPVGDAVWQ